MTDHRTPFRVEVYARVCDCRLPVRQVAQRRHFERAVEDARQYWGMMVDIYGRCQFLVHVQVVDVRDGRCLWRDGRQLSPADPADQAQQLLLAAFDGEVLTQEDAHGT